MADTFTDVELAIPPVAATFYATQLQPVDGDTVRALLDKHHNDYSLKTLRLLGVNTPEVRGPTREEGLAAKEFVWEWIREALTRSSAEPTFIVQTLKQEKYGRWLAYIWRTGDGECLNNALLKNRYAEPYAVIRQLADADEW